MRRRGWGSTFLKRRRGSSVSRGTARVRRVVRALGTAVRARVEASLVVRAAAARSGRAARDAASRAAAKLRAAASAGLAPLGRLEDLATRRAANALRALRLIGRRRLAPRRRSLVTEILAMQLAVTTLIGGGALAGLAWTSSVLIENNLLHWAHQWAGELNELGAPFYLRDERSALVNVERFISKYPEIASVTWYRPDGTMLGQLSAHGATAGNGPPLSPAQMAELEELVGADRPYLLREAADGSPRYRMAGPIWTESIVGDGLYDLATGRTRTALSGFVAVDLDFSRYHSEFVPRLVITSLALALLLGGIWAGGRALLKRALAPLEALQQPLAALAAGDRRLAFPSPRHRETAAIVKALEETTRALGERESRLLHLATHDPLTGLHNRYRLMEVLTEVVARASRERPGALLFIDLDQFKYVNDTCGHPAGDQILRLAAERIEAALRPGDLAARFGGDEFVVLLEDTPHKDAVDVADRILEELRGLSYVEQERVLHVQASIGITMIRSPRFAAHEVIAQGDIACREAKASGRNRKQIYKISKGQSERMLTDMSWAGSIREALEEDAFELLYQPILHIASRRVRHYEVLLRLRTKSGRLASPQTFLPAAIRFGLMADINRWVVTHALPSLATLRSARPDVSFSVNISSFAFEDPDFVPRVRRQLRENDLPGKALIFEITEQVAMRYGHGTNKQMAALRELGCRFALDDFGTGYSSLSYLKRLPVDYLKIDGSFVRDLSKDRVDQRMVHTIAEVARAVGMQTIAEYVQSETALRLLSRFGIDYAQGSHIGKPAPLPLAPAD